MSHYYCKQPEDSILDKMCKARVVEFEIRNNLLVATEQCDDYYDIGLNKKEALQFMEELRVMIESMKDE